MNKREYKKQQLVKLAFFIAFLILITLVSNFAFIRLDLTADKRFTLSRATRNVLGQVEDILHIRVYLDGDLPVGFRRMRTAVRELLDEFRMEAKMNIHYEFIDPDGIDDAMRDDLFRQLYDKGLRPSMIDLTEKGGGRSQKLIFPGALVTYNGMEMPVNLLKNNPALHADQNLNNSMQGIEYEFVSAFNTLLNPEIKKIAFLEGHGELDELLVSGISQALVRYYDIYRGAIDENNLKSLDNYDALVIAKPLRPFTEIQKYIIDQYIMKGGRVMWFIDPVSVDLDSLTYSSEAIALINDLNLDDQLFRYGVRLNPNLVMDMNCLLIPVNVALADEQARWVPAPWYFSPLLEGNDAHPVTKNLNFVKSEFASVIDTVATTSSISRDVLLRTSSSSRVLNAPLLVTLETARRPPNQGDFNQKHLPVAVMLEGEFPSVFANRIVSAIIGRNDPSFREKGERTRMLVVSDGDIIRNDVTVSGGVPEPLDLGYDRYSRQTYGNEEFILNALNYMLDETGLMELRTRELQLRLLDRSRVQEQLAMWQAVNMTAPLLLIIVSILLYNHYRKRQFAAGFMKIK